MLPFLIFDNPDTFKISSRLPTLSLIYTYFPHTLYSTYPYTYIHTYIYTYTHILVKMAAQAQQDLVIWTRLNGYNNVHYFLHMGGNKLEPSIITSSP
jgi:hypothetical protein